MPVKTKNRKMTNSRRSHAPTHITVLFEDEDIIVVEKPSGLLTIATQSEKRQTVYARLYDHVKSHRPPEKIFIVHRLDREASGLLVFAKQESAKFNLQQQFKQHDTGRTYLAVTEGQIKQRQFTIRSLLTENSIHRCYSTPDPRKGKLAITHGKVLKSTGHFTLAELNLETGRKHQIRVHLAEQGYPIVGDKAYGSPASPIHRLALHATKLKFKHPRTGELMEFQSPLPSSFLALLKKGGLPKKPLEGPGNPKARH
jgi:23S rRNA pseudouridine1911/1915/1917 synthase